MWSRLAGASVMACAASATAATTVCYPRDEMLSFIARDYSAAKEAVGIIRPFSVMEIWVSRRSDDWLIVSTDINGSSCIIAYGEDFAVAAPTAPVVAEDDKS